MHDFNTRCAIEQARSPVLGRRHRNSLKAWGRGGWGKVYLQHAFSHSARMPTDQGQNSDDELLLRHKISKGVYWGTHWP